MSASSHRRRYDVVFNYDWIDAVTLGVWRHCVHSGVRAFEHNGACSEAWQLVARVTLYDDDPYFCSVSVECDDVTTYRDVDLGDDSDPDHPWFKGNAVNLACEWIEAIVSGRDLPSGGEC